MVINPKAAKRFAEALHTRTKTDAVDAAVLAQFALRMPVTPWQRPDDLALAIRACARRIAALNQLRTQTKDQLHAVQQTATTPDFLIANLQHSIQFIAAQIEHLRRQALDLIATDEALQQSCELLISSTGIAAASAIQLLGELLVLPDDMQAKQWVAMAGLDPPQLLSGSSVSMKPRLSKAGIRYLRIALYMPALSAARHDPNVRAFYRHLIETRGLKKIHALCAVMRKLLLAIHAWLRRNAPVVGGRFYSPADFGQSFQGFIEGWLIHRCRLHHGFSVSVQCGRLFARLSVRKKGGISPSRAWSSPARCRALLPLVKHP